MNSKVSCDGGDMKRKKGCLPLKALGKQVIIRFSDHSILDSSPAECEIAGFVEKINEKEIILRWWSTFDGAATVPEMGDSNNEVARIVQGTLIRWADITPSKWENL